MNDDIPVLKAVRHGTDQYKVYCVYCKRWHFHSREEGHRVAHCYKETSPYRETGYILKESETG